MSEIFAFFKMLPAVVQFCVEAQRFLKSQLGQNPEQILLAMTDSFRALRESKTTEDRVNALKKIQDITSKL